MQRLVVCSALMHKYVVDVVHLVFSIAAAMLRDVLMYERVKQDARMIIPASVSPNTGRLCSYYEPLNTILLNSGKFWKEIQTISSLLTSKTQITLSICTTR